MKAVNIKTEYLKNPLGIDIENPRVMWNCEGGVTQNAYQIVTDDWDSGKIESSSMRIVVPVKFEKGIYFVMAMAIIIKNNVISMIIAVCMCTGIFTLIFSGINILIEKIGVKNFDINDYLIVNQISELDLSASAKTVGGAFAVAAVWAVVSLIAVYGVFKRRDI